MGLEDTVIGLLGDAQKLAEGSGLHRGRPLASLRTQPPLSKSSARPNGGHHLPEALRCSPAVDQDFHLAGQDQVERICFVVLVKEALGMLQAGKLSLLHQRSPHPAIQRSEILHRLHHLLQRINVHLLPLRGRHRPQRLRRHVQLHRVLALLRYDLGVCVPVQVHQVRPGEHQGCGAAGLAAHEGPLAEGVPGAELPDEGAAGVRRPRGVTDGLQPLQRHGRPRDQRRQHGVRHLPAQRHRRPHPQLGRVGLRGRHFIP
mmetsp:Transcript_135353/g.306237  ORF Transcript_135353/g.306237 Transcript_135353/m.306237 type:complete len:259 (-) Transcript_135353:671-1447(-)